METDIARSIDIDTDIVQLPVDQGSAYTGVHQDHLWSFQYGYQLITDT